MATLACKVWFSIVEARTVATSTLYTQGMCSFATLYQLFVCLFAQETAYLGKLLAAAIRQSLWKIDFDNR